METDWAAYGAAWLNLLLRWLHVVTGIAWIGASFYFVWLDNSIRPPAPGSELERKGVAGELWAVHGGGFYNPQKYLLAPKTLPPELHWFKWEAYSTWLSGFALLALAYWWDAGIMMADSAMAGLAPWQAVAIGFGTLALGWVVYDLLCRSPLGDNGPLFGALLAAFVLAVAYALCKLLGGRAAFIHVGAMLGTIMAGNVLLLIIPAQRKIVAALLANQTPASEHGRKAKQRSVHNNYLTLPVLVAMVSNHYGMLHGHAWNWLLLAGLMASGVLIRHFFNLRHKGRTVWGWPAAGVALLALVALAAAPRPPARLGAGSSAGSSAGSVGGSVAGSGAGSGERLAAGMAAPDFAQVRAIIAQRCASCHAQNPTQPGFAAAPAGVRLDSDATILRHAAKVQQQAVVLKAMPIGNLTGMTEDERAILGAWYATGVR